MDSRLLAVIVASVLAIGTTLAVNCISCSANDPSYCYNNRDLCQGTSCYFRHETPMTTTSRREYGCMNNVSMNGCVGDTTFTTCNCITEYCNAPPTIFTNGTKFR